ncbi:ATP-binding cassette domain-containing protein [Oenococcus sicerae]|uniref:ATP-binding cassette domain-containing protein n=1 Tax=Oenococcus sicerae TaxID=2203724 RepID=A0ABX5QKZ8_9LACO|nr:ATP-binding cassette domain-containing protein [Oenococcus sicerae]
MLAALKKVNLNTELGADPLTYQCGDQGKNLSGGQKERLSIARALLRKRPLFLLDEVTASLDQRNSEKIRDILYQLPQTVIEIAHHYDDKQIDKYHVRHIKMNKDNFTDLA